MALHCIGACHATKLYAHGMKKRVKLCVRHVCECIVCIVLLCVCALCIVVWNYTNILDFSSILLVMCFCTTSLDLCASDVWPISSLFHFMLFCASNFVHHLVGHKYPRILLTIFTTDFNCLVGYISFCAIFTVDTTRDFIPINHYLWHVLKHYRSHALFISS